jgi:hypothetical protein
VHSKFGVKDLEYGAPRHVGGMVSILAYNFLARRDSTLTIDFMHT